MQGRQIIMNKWITVDTEHFAFRQPDQVCALVFSFSFDTHTAYSSTIYECASLSVWLGCDTLALCLSCAVVCAAASLTYSHNIQPRVEHSVIYSVCPTDLLAPTHISTFGRSEIGALFCAASYRGHLIMQKRRELTISGMDANEMTMCFVCSYIFFFIILSILLKKNIIW